MQWDGCWGVSSIFFERIPSWLSLHGFGRSSLSAFNSSQISELECRQCLMYHSFWNSSQVCFVRALREDVAVGSKSVGTLASEAQNDGKGCRTRPGALSAGHAAHSPFVPRVLRNTAQPQEQAEFKLILTCQRGVRDARAQICRFACFSYPRRAGALARHIT